MSTGDRVISQLERTIEHHRNVHRHAVREARELRARLAAEAAGMPVTAAEVLEPEPQGMPAGMPASDPTAGL